MQKQDKIDPGPIRDPVTGLWRDFTEEEENQFRAMGLPLKPVKDIPVINAPTGYNLSNNEFSVNQTGIPNHVISADPAFEIFFEMRNDGHYVKCIRDFETQKFRQLTEVEKRECYQLGFTVAEFSFPSVDIPVKVQPKEYKVQPKPFCPNLVPVEPKAPKPFDPNPSLRRKRSLGDNTCQNYVTYFEFIIKQAVDWIYFHRTKFETCFNTAKYNSFMEDRYYKVKTGLKLSQMMKEGLVERCKYIFKRGAKKGEYCPYPANPGDLYCSTCCKKKTIDQSRYIKPDNKIIPEISVTTKDFVKSMYIENDDKLNGIVSLLKEIKLTGVSTDEKQVTIPPDIIDLVTKNYYVDSFVDHTLKFIEKLKDHDDSILDDIVFPKLTTLTMHDFSHEHGEPEYRHTIEDKTGIKYRQLLDCYMRIIEDKNDPQPILALSFTHNTNNGGYLDEIKIGVKCESD